MVQMTARVRGAGMAGVVSDLRTRLKAVETAELAARSAAAATATAATRQSFHYVGRPADVPERPGRRSTHGKFPNYLKWVVGPGPAGDVHFDLAEADAEVPYWIILEIGTGERAVLRRGGAPNPRGRARSGTSYVRTVKSQRGRLISTALGFAGGPNGVYTAPQSGRRDQQLYLISQLTGPRGGKVRRSSSRQLRISKEIQGQHFVKKGGTTGFREYQTTVLAAARRAFDGRKG